MLNIATLYDLKLTTMQNPFIALQDELYEAYAAFLDKFATTKFIYAGEVALQPRLVARPRRGSRG